MEEVLNALSKFPNLDHKAIVPEALSLEPKDGRLFDMALQGIVKGYESGFADFGRRFCSYKIATGQFDFIPGLQSMREELEKYEGKFNKPFGYWITVNPRPDTDREVFISRIEKWMSKAWVHDCVIGIEYRQYEPDIGLHAHIYVRYFNKRYSEVRRETLSTFRKFIGNDKHVHIRLVKEADEGRVVNYCIKDKDVMGTGEVFQQLYMPKPPPKPEIVFEE